MKYTYLLILSILSLYVQAQQPTRYADKTSSVDSIISNLYGVISGDSGVDRDWELLRHLFHPDARMIPTVVQGDTTMARFFTVDQYIRSSSKYLETRGFHEREITRTIDSFGSMVHVFSSYETFHEASDSKPFMRGINSIQLLYDGDRWYILNIYWRQESKLVPLPEAYE